MTINIKNGQHIIDILSDGFVSCLKIRKPIAVDWYDGAGSSGKYFAFTTNYKPIAKQFNTKNAFLNYFQCTNEYPMGIWDGMNIKSESDFSRWIMKTFGKSIDDIKNMIE